MNLLLEHRGIAVQHTMKRWEVKRNRHTTTSGYDWGWIEGSLNVCWSNDGPFTECVAGEICRIHNEWLENLRPIDKRIVEAKQDLKLKRQLLAEASKVEAKACDDVRLAVAEVERLEAMAVKTTDPKVTT